MTKREKIRLFMKWYEGSLADTEGVHAAYQLTETTWIAEFGDRMYKNYESFRACRHHFLKHIKTYHPKQRQF